MNIDTILSPERIIINAQVENKESALVQLTELLAAGAVNAPAPDILEALKKRENLGSTGLGRKIAIPHGRMSTLESPVAAVVLSETGIDFDAIDDEPVDVFFAMVVPDNGNDEHLYTLAFLAEMFSDPSFHGRVRQCQSNADVYALLTETQTNAA